MPALTSQTREEPRDRRIAQAITGFHSECVAALRELKRAVWRSLELPRARRAPGDDAIEFGPVSQAEFNRAVDIFLEEMAGRDRSRLGFANASTESGLIEKWGRFTHAIGVRMAEEMVGADASAMGLGENEAALQAFMEHAFDRLSENGALRLEGIRDELHRIISDAVARNVNPIGLARDLSDRFAQYERYEFERLARTETAFAQNAGLADEFNAQGVDMSGVQADMPPFHPNCLCAISIEPKDGGGWSAVYDIATTACGECQTYAS